jgi:UDP-N-acetylglucosamine--N-acetylmuramyl-(pentapeptide) pyrophosphoryl-undecaprenol N-acetylglucosamine transferase
MTRILFTGGGSAGHVTPNIGLIERCQKEGWEVFYVGSENGIEKTIVQPTGVPFYSVASGKLRRYFSWQNFTDPFRILLGFIQSLLICWRLKPLIIFSKGGFVSVPVVVAGWLNRIPVISHESDITPGLANRLCVPFSTRVCVTFPQTQKYIDARKVLVTGTPVRQIILRGEAGEGRRLLNLNTQMPIVLIFGGSLGAVKINRVVRDSLDELLADFQLVHVCGNGNIDQNLLDRKNYHQAEYFSEEFGHVLACADIVVSRAGANSIYEILVARKPHILIPLSTKASRGDQIINARVFTELGYSKVIEDDLLDSQTLVAAIQSTLHEREAISRKLMEYEIPDAVEKIYGLIEELSNQ